MRLRVPWPTTDGQCDVAWLPGVVIDAISPIPRFSTYHIKSHHITLTCVTADNSSSIRSLFSVINPANRSIEQELVLPLWYADLHPGDAVTVATLSISGEKPSADAHRASLLSSSDVRVGMDGSVGYTDVAVRVRVAASSYASFSLNVTSTE